MDGAGGGLGGMGNYLMTPFDVLHSVFAGSEVTAVILEEALVMTAWDVDQAIQWIVETVVPNPTGLSPSPSSTFGAIRTKGLSPMNPNSAPSSPLPQNRTVGASGSRPLIVSRDSFDGYGNGNGGRGSPMNGSNEGTRWPSQQQGSRPGTPNSNGGDAGRAIGGRVCRYYLSGACLRSDCHFSHESVTTFSYCEFSLIFDSQRRKGCL